MTTSGGDEDTGAAWLRIDARDAFVSAFADRPLYGAEGVVFTIHASGRLTGTIDGKYLTGEWFWQDGLFCRRASLGGEDLGVDCELIWKRGSEMMYRGDGGSAPPVIVSLNRD
jgi:hypothetical protein